ncbi:MAG: hypothetical protein QXL78_04620 [Methanocellales archaeon]
MGVLRKMMKKYKLTEGDMQEWREVKSWYLNMASEYPQKCLKCGDLFYVPSFDAFLISRNKRACLCQKCLK